MTGKRGPSVLVTDSRDRPALTGARSSRSSGPLTARSRGSMRSMTVDNVLQFASDIPSARPRMAPLLPLRGPSISFSGTPSLIPAQSLHAPAGPAAAAAGSAIVAGGGGTGSVSGLAGPPARLGQPLPSRTTKISEKLVLLPDSSLPSRSGRSGRGGPGISDDDDEEEDDDDVAVVASAQDRRLGELDADNSQRPAHNEELDVLRKRRGVRGKSYAERLPKAQRAAQQLARVTAYCTAQAFKVKEAAGFLRDRHEARTKLYDDCLYVVYALPLLPGTDGFRLRSRPILRTPGSTKTVLDLEIERSERRDWHEGYFLDDNGTIKPNAANSATGPTALSAHEVEMGRALRDGEGDSGGLAMFHGMGGMSGSPTMPPRSRLLPSEQQDSFAEMFVFSYGVVVFWNFSEYQEKDILADLTFATVSPSSFLPSALGGGGGRSSSARRYHQRSTRTTSPSDSPGPDPELTPGSDVEAGQQQVQQAVQQRDQQQQQQQQQPSLLMVRPLEPDDFETEEFHFEYSADVTRPRVFNDMITLLPRSDHMIRLTISHAIAQSTKLCFFEARMLETTDSAQHVPRDLALTGELNMTRTEIVKILGRLFKSRVDINLSSNILDVPNFFWESEPTLHPLYVAIRDYLEIEPRIRVLNERCRVFLDLAEILADSVADAKMNAITWTIIILIVVSILVTVTEVALRFGLLRGRATTTASASASAIPLARTLPDHIRLVDLRRWLQLLTEQDRQAVCAAPAAVLFSEL